MAAPSPRYRSRLVGSPMGKVRSLTHPTAIRPSAIRVNCQGWVLCADGATRAPRSPLGVFTAEMTSRMRCSRLGCVR